MANVCIPKQVIEKLRTAIKSGAIDLEKLYDLGDAGRHELFSKYVGEDNVSLANSKFEEDRQTEIKNIVNLRIKVDARFQSVIDELMVTE